MAIRNDREYRFLGGFEIRKEEQTTENEKSYIVEGYASTFEPYEMLVWDGVTYYERIAPTAFEKADLSDVVFLRDHEGRVLARTKNNTVSLYTDEHGLHTRTDLCKTGASREMFEDIEAGNYTQMSFAFTVEKDHFEEDTNTRVIDEIRKVYDVSAVAFPANPTTDIGISARDIFNGAIEARERAERLEAEKQKKAEALKALEEKINKVKGLC